MSTFHWPEDPQQWPNLYGVQKALVFGIPALTFPAAWFVLRVVYPPKAAAPKEVDHANYGALEQGGEKKKNEFVMDDGNEKLSYKDVEWTKGFDFAFMILMASALAVLCVATSFVNPELWSNKAFWISQLPKLLVMMGISTLGGLICRHFCHVGDQGYLTTNKDTWFRVNYTRKLQHFAAYAVPLFVKSPVEGTLALCWGDWITLLGFFLLIKPIREMNNPIGKFFMIQFNSLDRPEDRPDTIKWIVGGNIIPGLCCIIFFRHLYAFTHQEAFSFIWIFVTGIGDGFAEPVGIAWGKHKYKTHSLFSSVPEGADEATKAKIFYTRSLEGSACVFISGMVFTAMYWYVFANPWQFWTCMIAMPPLMAWAEAVSPHTMDTPFLMGLGGVLCLAISHIHVSVY